MKRLSVFLVLYVLASLTHSQVKYTTPTCPGMHVSILNGISNNGVMVGGYYTDNDPLFHPFVINKKSKCVPLGQNTVLAQKFGFASGVNDRGDIVGVYYDDGYFSGATHGFWIDKKGKLTLIEFPTADGTAAYGINEAGTIVGAWYVNDSLGNMLFQHGFVWNDGTFTDVVYAAYYRTMLGGINARGEVVGNGIDQNFIAYPFLYSNGGFTPLSVIPSGIGAAPSGINNKGEIVGQFLDEGRTLHGFLQAGSAFTTFDHPAGIWTTVQGINNAGQMVGSYWDSNWALQGFFIEKK
jgi:uncharacterized membrane protein